MKPGARDRRGMALLTVLLLVAVMAALCVVLLDDVRFSVRRTTNAESQAQAQGFAAGAEALARRRLSDLVGLILPARRFSPSGTAASSPCRWKTARGGR